MGRVFERAELLGNAVPAGRADVNLGKVCALFLRVGLLPARQTCSYIDGSFKPPG